MEKLLKNWVFTLITCILLSILSLLMFLDGFGIGDDIYLGQRIIHMITAVMLVLYLIFAICPLMKTYRGAAQGFLMFELVMLALTAVAQACMEFVNIPFLSTLPVCSALGLALWLRGVVLTIRAYQLQLGEHQKRIPLWRLVLYILLSAFGVWQMAKPTIPDQYFIFCIAVVALIFAVIFGALTAQNRKGKGKKNKNKKEEKKEEAPALPAAKE